MAIRTGPAVLFDVMDTLVRDPFPQAICGFFGITRDELFSEKHPTAWIEFERGQLTPAEYYAKMFADERAFDTAAFEACLRRSYAWIDGMRELVQELAASGHELHALSNYPAWYRMLDAELGVSQWVPWTFVSCETGRRKPEPAAFIEAARALGRAPGDIVVVDDRVANCEAARSLGMRVIRFEGAESARAALAHHGIG